MKSEERHRLKENELGRVVQSTGSMLERYATTLVACVCVTLLVAAAVVWWMRQTTALSSAAWTLLEDAKKVGDFDEIAVTYKNTSAGDWARLLGSESYLQSGGDALFLDRDLANTDLKRAREGFEQLVASASAGPIIRERAEWGLARCLESTSDGDTAKAITAYQRLLDDFPETIYEPFAKERIAALKTGGAREFYAWFSKQNPKPADLRPKDGAVKGDFDPFDLPPAAGAADGKSQGDDATPPAKSDDAATDKPGSSEAKPDATKDESPPAKPDDAKVEKKPVSDEPKSGDKPEKSSDDSEKKQP